MKAICRGAVCIVCIVLSLPAHAQDPSVKELFDNGQLLYESGQYDLAIEAWNEALARSGRPILLIKLANAREAQGDYYAAIGLLEQYLQDADPAEHDSLDAQIEQLRRRIMAQQAESAEPDPRAASSSVTTVEPAATPPALTERRRLGTDLSLGGLTVAGIGVGTGFGIAALASRRQALVFCEPLSPGPLCTDDASPALRQDRVQSTLSDVGFAVAVSAVLTWTAVEIFREDRGPDLQVSLTPNGASLRWSIR